MLRSLWSALVGRVDDLIQHLREVSHQPDQPNKPRQSDQPGERHVCRLNAGYTCACPRGACACDDATYRHARGPYIATSAGRGDDAKPVKHGSHRCPISGQFCAGIECRDWCESGVNRSKT